MNELAERCGNLLESLLDSRGPEECVLPPGHSGSHAGECGTRWRLAAPPLTLRQNAAVRPLETPAGGDVGTETPEGAAGAQAGTQPRARLTADTATDDGLDWLYAELARTRADAANLLAANGALRDACARWRVERDAERADLAEARAERDRARDTAVELEQQLAAVAALHVHNADADYSDLCANHGDIQWPCATIRALNPQEEP